MSFYLRNYTMSLGIVDEYLVCHNVVYVFLPVGQISSIAD